MSKELFFRFLVSLKNIESILFVFFKKRIRYRYAKHDLLVKLNHMEITPIPKEQFNKVKSFYSKLGISIDKKWFDLFYSLNHSEYKLEYYIPHNLYYVNVEPFYSDIRKAGFCDDKLLYDVYFHDAKQPHTVIRKVIINNGKTPLFLDDKYNLISKDEVIRICKLYEQLIIKQSSNSSGGKGISFYSSTNSESMNYILNGDKPLVVQEILEQHYILNQLHSSSVNTIRIITLIRDNQVFILSSVLRMGHGGAKVDNASSGGIFCGIMPDGRLKDVAYNCKGELFKKHPQGAFFNEITIPNFDKCLSFVKNLAPRVSSISQLVSWDLAVDKEGCPVLIEANLTFGEIDFHQMCNGPIFGEMTESILRDVFKE